MSYVLGLLFERHIGWVAKIPKDLKKAGIRFEKVDRRTGSAMDAWLWRYGTGLNRGQDCILFGL